MTTTAVRPTTSPDAVLRRARIGTVGAALWALSPAVWYVSLEEADLDPLSFAAVAVLAWVCLFVAPLLLVAGHRALRAALGPAAGRVGAIGIATAATGLTAMALGIGIELASITAGGGEVAVGHAILMVGFLVGIVGALLTGITVIRRRRDGASRVAGWLLTLALPLGIGVGQLGLLLVPGNDAGFWAALTLPTGIAWLLLGRALATERTASA